MFLTLTANFKSKRSFKNYYNYISFIDNDPFCFKYRIWKQKTDFLAIFCDSKWFSFQWIFSAHLGASAASTRPHFEKSSKNTIAPVGIQNNVPQNLKIITRNDHCQQHPHLPSQLLSINLLQEAAAAGPLALYLLLLVAIGGMDGILVSKTDSRGRCRGTKLI